MAKLNILKYGNPVLKKKAEPVTEFNEDLKQLFNDMLEAMYAKNGVGLAATQLGVLKRVIVVDITRADENPQVFLLVNPEIIQASKEKCEYEEGCLSFPEITETISRSRKVTVKAQDIFGKPIEIEGEGLLAIALQHEIDHINGILFIDRMSPVRKLLHAKELNLLKKANTPKKKHK